MCSMNDFDQALPSSFSHMQPPEQWYCWQHLQELCQIGPRDYVCTCWWTTAPRRTGRPRRWCSNWVTWPPVGYTVISLIWRQQTVGPRLRYPWESPGRFGVSVTGVKSTYFTSVTGNRPNVRSWIRIRSAQQLHNSLYFESISFLADKKHSAKKKKSIGV